MWCSRWNMLTLVSMLTRLRTKPHNPIEANWDKLYVACQLRNLMVHEKRTGLERGGSAVTRIDRCLGKVISQYQEPVTIAHYLQRTQKNQNNCF